MEQTATQIGNEKPWYLLEDRQVFSQSLLWDLQRQYFAEKGVDAWRQGEVPDYITTNPTIANRYAEVVFACLRDNQRNQPSDEPLYLCELGAGSGRFAYHFLRRLARLCEPAGVPLKSFRYVLTDFTQSNLDFWRGHPRFQSFFESGALDISLFDVTQSDHLALRISGERISAGSLDRPLVVIANYLFDSIPQDLFYINDQRSHRCRVSLRLNEDRNTLTPAELLERVQYRYDIEEIAETPYQEAYLQQLLADYQRALSDTYLLFPAAGLRCLQRLRDLSKQGLISLSADKGSHHVSALRGRAAPDLVVHGSFSLNVNYHAFKSFCEQSEGVALFPEPYYQDLNVSCLLMVKNPSTYIETQRAYQHSVQDLSPDDFFRILKQARQHISEMGAEEMLAFLRFCHYDSNQFGRYVPRFIELSPELNLNEREAVRDACDRVWDLYFPLGEELDLAYLIGCLLYEMDYYTDAITYFERSIEIYGQQTGALFNMAACYALIEQFGQAESLLRKVLEYDADNQQARALLTDIKERIRTSVGASVSVSGD